MDIKGYKVNFLGDSITEGVGISDISKGYVNLVKEKLGLEEAYNRGILKENDIPYCVWNYLSTPNDGNRFSLVDDDNRKILSEEMARIIKGEV